MVWRIGLFVFRVFLSLSLSLSLSVCVCVCVCVCVWERERERERERALVSPPHVQCLKSAWSAVFKFLNNTDILSFTVQLIHECKCRHTSHGGVRCFRFTLFHISVRIKGSVTYSLGLLINGWPPPQKKGKIQVSML